MSIIIGQWQPFLQTIALLVAYFSVGMYIWFWVKKRKYLGRQSKKPAFKKHKRGSYLPKEPQKTKKDPAYSLAHGRNNKPFKKNKKKGSC